MNTLSIFMQHKPAVCIDHLNKKSPVLNPDNRSIDENNVSQSECQVHQTSQQVTLDFLNAK